jgi:trimeric autotransporter adhesin
LAIPQAALIRHTVIFRNTTGNFNTASGSGALQSNTTGFKNTANGVQALFSNTTGTLNTANGVQALFSNTEGFENTANGFLALSFNTTGNFNTAAGSEALQSNTEGIENTANGHQALFFNTTGNNNTAAGAYALGFNTTGTTNTAIGYSALLNNTTGGSNIALGYLAGENLTIGSNNIHIGNAGAAGESNKIRTGTRGTHNGTSIAGIFGVPLTGSQVLVTSSGRLGTVVSSARFKEEVKPMDNVSEAIHALKPVIFRYKHELDPDGILQFGLVAEEVEKVNSDLVARDDDGKPYTVRYEAVNAMLLNEFLKEHRRVETLEATVARQQSINAEQQKEIQALTASLNEQATQIQKVSAQLEMSRPAPQTIVNNP